MALTPMVFDANGKDVSDKYTRDTSTCVELTAYEYNGYVTIYFKVARNVTGGSSVNLCSTTDDAYKPKVGVSGFVGQLDTAIAPSMILTSTQGYIRYRGTSINAFQYGSITFPIG